MSRWRVAPALNVLTGLLVISIAMALAGLTWRLLGDAGSPPLTAPAAHRPAPSPDLAPVLALAPFGRISGAQAPATSLGIQLRGIVRASPPSASTALISTSGGPARPYMVGQSPAGGGVIAEISVDHVLLRVNGRIEMLAFPKVSTTTSQPVAAAAPPPPAPLPAAPAAVAPPPIAPTALLDSLGASPSHAGYVVGNPSVAMRRAGLQPGDVIEKINGTLVGNPDRDRQLLTSSALSGGARIDVLREGKRITFSLPLR